MLNYGTEVLLELWNAAHRRKMLGINADGSHNEDYCIYCYFVGTDVTFWINVKLVHEEIK